MSCQGERTFASPNTIYVSLFCDLYTSGVAITNKNCSKFYDDLCVNYKHPTYIFWPPKSDASNARNLLETQSEERLSRLTLRT